MLPMDRVTARALVESGYMPLSQYAEMYEPQLMLQHVASPNTAPQNQWEKLEGIVSSTTFDFK